MSIEDYELSARAWLAIVLHCAMTALLTHVGAAYGALYVAYTSVFLCIALLGVLVADDKRKRKRKR